MSLDRRTGITVVVLLALTTLLILPARGRADDDKELDLLIQVAGDTNEREDIRGGAIKKIGGLGAKGKKAVPTLVKVAQEQANNSLGEAAVVAIGNIGPEAKAAIPDLGALLKEDAKADLRYVILVAFGKMGAEAKEAGPFMARTMKDALSHTYGTTTEPLLQEVHDDLCALVVDQLEKMPAEASAVAMNELDRYIRCLVSRDDKFVRPKGLVAAVRLLGKVGNDDAVMRLKRLLLSDDKVIKDAAAKALEDIKGREKK